MEIWAKVTSSDGKIRVGWLCYDHSTINRHFNGIMKLLRRGDCHIGRYCSMSRQFRTQFRRLFTLNYVAAECFIFHRKKKPVVPQLNNVSPSNPTRCTHLWLFHQRLIISCFLFLLRFRLLSFSLSLSLSLSPSLLFLKTMFGIRFQRMHERIHKDLLFQMYNLQKKIILLW